MPGTYEIIYKVTNSKGNSIEVKRFVKVKLTKDFTYKKEYNNIDNKTLSWGTNNKKDGNRPNTDISNEELKKYIFGGDYVNLLYFRIFGQKDTKIPFIQKYDVETDWPDRLYVTVYEKAIVGYVRYMGCNMYFDKDGIVVESSTDLYENVPQIDGLKFDSIVINTKLDVGNADIYNTILDLIQSFDKYDIDVDKVYFDASYNITLYMGDVKVSLGSSKDFTDRLFELKQLSSRFGTLKGTLYLDDYNGDESSIIFKREK